MTPITPTRRDWPRLLDELVRQLNDGRVYDRDLAQIQAALIQLVEAHRRRTGPAVRDRNFPWT
nr:hypothetical protein [Petropleomorpha daqingensis]